MGKLTVKNRGGRPSSFSKSIADKIVNQLASGKTLKKICENKEMPDVATVLRWVAKGNDEESSAEFKEFRKLYAQAREVQAAVLFDEMLEIADDTSLDSRVDDKGNEYPNAEWIGRSRLRLDARKFYLSKVLPKVYGDKVSHEYSGGMNVVVKKYKWEEEDDDNNGDRNSERLESAPLSAAVMESAEQRG